LFKIKTLKKNNVLSIESIFSKDIGGPEKGRWGSPKKGCFYWDAAISASQSSNCRGAGGEISSSQSSPTGGAGGCDLAFFFFFGHSIPGVGSWKWT
jgi:putative hemolysin